MGKEFLACVNSGGRIVTKTVNDKQYIHICFPKGGGPSVAGEVRTKESALWESKPKKE
jgi:hypothetical protein